ncbi:MAG: RodZ domain-containing protein [Elusimicrobiota bacterium]
MKPTTQKVGELLRAKRLEKGLSLEKVRDTTKITTKFLVSIEESNYKTFPARVYLRGFLMTYARFLGFAEPLAMWEQVVAEEDLSFFDRRDPSENRLDNPIRRPVRNPVQTLARNRGNPEGAWERFIVWTTSGQNWILAFLVAPALIVMCFYAVYSYQRRQAYQHSPEKLLELSTIMGQGSSNQTIQSPFSGTAKQPTQSWTSTQGKEPITVEIRSQNEPTWVQVDIDNRMVFQGVLPAGQNRVYQSREAAKLRIGTPKTIAVSVNGVAWNFTAAEMAKAPLELDISREAIAQRQP